MQARTRELTQSVEELRALGEISQAVNSTLDLQTVLDTIVGKATQLSGTEAGVIYVFDCPGLDHQGERRMEKFFHGVPKGSPVTAGCARCSAKTARGACRCG